MVPFLFFLFEINLKDVAMIEPLWSKAKVSADPRSFDNVGMLTWGVGIELCVGQARFCGTPFPQCCQKSGPKPQK
jgi:hypothetical protein